MKTNELKKDMRIKLHNGWYGTVKDNKKGNIRFCEIEGLYTELGSIYVWEIESYISPEGDNIPIELTPKQIKDHNMVESFGF